MNALEALMNDLPPVWPEDLLPAIRKANAASDRALVVLEDDPTGTPTVQDAPVLTEWTMEALSAELKRGTPLFHVLTNSRRLPRSEAVLLANEIGNNLARAAQQTRRQVTVISRSDSTLRGHYPFEVDALLGGLGQPGATHLLVPFFEEGGRVTFGDFHYVAEQDRLVRVADTPFARDTGFAFAQSNLRHWVEEKTLGSVLAAEVRSITLRDVRSEGPAAVTRKLLETPVGGVCIANAVVMRDVEVLVAGLLEAERKCRKYIARTAASFVRARAGLGKQPLLNADSFLSRQIPTRSKRGGIPPTGGLIVVGSHVSKTTAQLNSLLRSPGPALQQVELPVTQLLAAKRQPTIAATVPRIDALLAAGTDVVLSTSRQLVTGRDAADSLAISARVSSALVEVVQRLETVPRFLIAKGGITASDVATQGLRVKRAITRGQLLPGVPVWQLGEESKYPGLNFIVFPGNVGGDDALHDAYIKLGGGRAGRPASEPPAARTRSHERT